MESVYKIIRALYDLLIDIVFPEKCIVCNIRGLVICDKCSLNFRKTERKTANNIYACYDYRDPAIKNAIWKLKYHHRGHIGARLGQLIYQEFVEDISEIKQYIGNKIIVIPVPISKSKIKKRGYNQAKYIAKGFCDSNKDSFELRGDLVIKVKDTLPQAKISNRNRRLNNVKGVFSISDESFVRGKTFIIIDDVTTTGSTFLEITKVLKNTGARKVICFAVAH